MMQVSLLLLCLLHAKIVNCFREDYSSPYNHVKSSSKEEGWSQWSEWSTCSRTCGGGVAIQSRRCLHFQGCRGSSVRYNVCKLESCPKNVPDLLSEQCSEFDSIPYNGQLHEWEPALGNAPCALTCRAKGQDGPPVVLNSRVIDGTRCANYSEGMCVHGQCQMIGCDLVLGSLKKKDVCGVCDGDGSSCRKTHWVKRGLGPCSATCGGGYRVVTVTCKDVLTGQEVDQKQCSHTPKPSQVVVNCGEKTCPAEWKVVEWEPCSVTCGNGYQLREVACVERRNVSTVRVADHECTDPRPPHRRSCGGDECPRWFGGIWSECSVTCGEGVQRRAVQCRYSTGSSSNDCSLKLRPNSTRPCRTGARCPPSILAHPRHIVTKWSAESEETANFLPSEEPLSHKQKVPAEPTFIASAWSTCSKTCGEGVHTREVTCKIFLEFSRTVAVLPDSQCPGSRPVEAKRCSIKSCSAVMMREPSREEKHSNPFASLEHSNGDAELRPLAHPLHGKIPHNLQFIENDDSISNDYEAFRAPSHDSEEIPRFIPLEKNRRISETLPRIEETYHVYPYEERYMWKSAGYTQCSASCLGGVQESIFYCIRVADLKRVSFSLCDRASRPDSITRTCNDHSCPPHWEESPFEPCTKSCGGGITRRQVHCVHQVTRSKMSKLVVSNSECRQPPPYAQKFCNMNPCPPSWDRGNWSKCSVICGRGFKTREVNCIQMSSLGRREKISESHCAISRRPSSRRSCNTCIFSTHKRRRKRKRKGPVIKSQPTQQYYQNKFMKTVNLKIGGQASVFHGAKIKIKCPVRRFNRQHLTWWRNGQRLDGLNKIRRIRVNWKGVLKINRIQYTDAAVYICKAGDQQANLTVKVQPLPASFANIEEGNEGDKVNEVFSGDTKNKPKFHESSFSKTGFNLAENVNKKKTIKAVSGDKETRNSIKSMDTNLHTYEETNNGKDAFQRRISGGLGRPIVYGTVAHHGTRGSSSDGGISLLSDKVLESRRQQGTGFSSYKNMEELFGTFRNSTESANKNGNHKEKVFGTLLNKFISNEPDHHSMSSDASHIRAHKERSAQTRYKKGSVFDLIADAASDSGLNTPLFLGKGSRDSLQFEWIVTNWTECSQTCSFSGSSGGYQVRSMQCVVRVNNVSTVVEGALCEDAGLSAPPTIQQCGSAECPQWSVDLWSNCENSRCFTLHYAFQKRQVKCLLHNDTVVSNSFCDDVTKPRHRRECYNRQCIGVWRTEDWSKCTAPCGGHGYRTRILQCAWNGTKKSAGNACREQSRPEVVRWCDGSPCSSEDVEKPDPGSDCQDMSRYCKIVKRINMCRVKLYHEKCCRSCQ